jgi:hypothetical protein
MSSSETVFVEEYRKELGATGYPFTELRAIITAAGYSLPVGAIADASIYCDSSADIPQLTAITNQDATVTFTVGRYAASVDLNQPKEVIEFYDASGVFGGIFVLNLSKIMALRSWKNGVHTVTNPASFCARCLEIIPVTGVQRLRTDTNRIAAGRVVLTGGRGCLLRLLRAPSGITYVEAGFTGDPTYSIRAAGSVNRTPVQRVLCKDTFGTEISLSPDAWNGISVIACNTFESALHEDALRLITAGSVIQISLGGL